MVGGVKRCGKCVVKMPERVQREPGGWEGSSKCGALCEAEEELPFTHLLGLNQSVIVPHSSPATSALRPFKAGLPMPSIRPTWPGRRGGVNIDNTSIPICSHHPPCL